MPKPRAKAQRARRVEALKKKLGAQIKEFGDRHLVFDLEAGIIAGSFDSRQEASDFMQAQAHAEDLHLEPPPNKPTFVHP